MEQRKVHGAPLSRLRPSIIEFMLIFQVNYMHSEHHWTLVAGVLIPSYYDLITQYQGG
jgi:hypothetical protein